MNNLQSIEGNAVSIAEPPTPSRTSEDGFASLVDLLRYRAHTQPDRRAFTFLLDGERDERHLTYGELDRLARSLAVVFESLDAQGRRALLLFPPGLDYLAAFFGCLYAGVTAVPAYPPRRNRSVNRLQSIVRDSGAAFALTTTEILADVERRFSIAPQLAGLRWLAADQLWLGDADDWEEPKLDRRSLAFLQYTSGSTAAPKGVMVSHGNLLENSALIHAAFETSSESRGVIWLPPYHDMGLIGGILQPVYGGFPVVIMSPVAFLQHPIRWLKAISHYRATASGGPNFAYDLCIRKTTEEQRASLDLSSWRVAFNGSEAVRAQTLDRFAEVFAECGFKKDAFFPCYGLAESTLFVTGGPRGSEPYRLDVDTAALERHQLRCASGTETRTLVGSGATPAQHRVQIVDPETRIRCADDEVGEIWVAGDSVALGYWNRPETTDEVFRARLVPTYEGPWLRTGDLGFIHAGQLFVTGRAKDLIIIRGRNHYPQDIEQTVEQCHPALVPGAGAAFSIEVDGEERLVIVHEVQRRPKEGMDTEAIASAMREAIADQHDLDLYALTLIRTGTIPKTSSGKIQRHACQAGHQSGDLQVVATWTHEAPAAAPVAAALGEPREPMSERAASKAEQKVQVWLLERLADILKIDPTQIDVREPFTHYGLGSLEAVTLSGDLEDWLGREVPPTIAYDYPTVEALAKHLAGASDVRSFGLLSSQAREEVLSQSIAIVGIGCRFPGADGPDAFWQLLSEGRDGVRETPPERWDVEAFYDPNPGTPGKICTRRGGFVDQVDEFDARFFGIAPREAVHMDPQQRLLLEVAWEAFEDAGYSPEHLSGSATGVYVGIGGFDYTTIHFRHPDYPHNVDAYAGTGNTHSIAANRLSYLLDLRGPSFPVDTACSSSLVAIHLACRSLQQGESDLAIAGGVNLILSPEVTISFSSARMLATDGRCKSFDARADGYVRSEGCGLIVLKRLSEALSDGDHIHAVIRGSAINQDGRTAGITVPNGPAQQAVIRSALDEAGIQPAQFSYIEAHGTGTALGDPIEIQALSEVLGSPADEADRCVVGSVKANIGHLETASGVAGLIKVILALRNEAIPGQIHLESVNPHIKLDGSKIRFPTELTRWEHSDQRPRIAGVNSFGFGGANAHVILEEAPRRALPPEDYERPLHLLTLSAQSESALGALVGRYESALVAEEMAPADVCYTANTGRAHFGHRLSVLGADIATLRAGLAAYREGKRQPGVTAGSLDGRQAPRIAFLFTGQGSQYIGMGRELYDTQPVFKRALDHCADVLEAHLKRPLLSVLFPENESDEGLIDETAYTQPTLFAIEYALAELWQSWGIEPTVVLGHSVGEYVAACVAGVFSLEDGLKLIAQRAARMQALPAGGGMAAILTDTDKVLAAVAEIDGVEPAALNGPTNTVVAGTNQALDTIVDRFAAQGVRTQRLSVSHAFHSALMEPMLDGFETFARGLTYHAPEITLISNLTGAVLEPGVVPDAAYWRRHVREPVRFVDGIGALAEVGVDIMLEVGPHPVLTAMAKRIDKRRELVWLPSLKKDAAPWEMLLDSLATLYHRGAPIDWVGFDKPYGRLRLPLPTYPFERKRYWLEEGKAAAAAASPARQAPGASHPLLGRRLRSALPTAQFESILSPQEIAYLKDHVVQESIVLPGTAYLEMAVAGAREAFDKAAACAERVAIVEPLFFPEGKARTLQILYTPLVSGVTSFQILGLPLDSEGEQGGWKVHATGKVVVRGESSLPPAEDLAAVRARCTQRIGSDDLYAGLAANGLAYGPSFRGVVELSGGTSEALGRVRLPEGQADIAAKYMAHPALLDAGLHVLAGALGSTPNAGTYIPTGVERYRLYAERLEPELFVHARLRPAEGTDRSQLKADLRLLDQSGRVIAALSGLELSRLGRDEEARDEVGDFSDWLYEINWVEKQQAAEGDALAGKWLVFGTAGEGELLVERLRSEGCDAWLAVPGEGYSADAEARRMQVDPADPESTARAIADAFGDMTDVAGIVHLWGADAVEDELSSQALERAQVVGVEHLLLLVQALAKVGWPPGARLVLATRGARSIEGETLSPAGLAQAPMLGLAGVVAFEHAELGCTRVDLDPQGPGLDTLIGELRAADGEDQIAWRGGRRLVARLKPSAAAAAVKADASSQSKGMAIPPRRGNRQIGMDITRRGAISNLCLTRTERPQDERDAVVFIEVQAGGLNFRDVMNAMGLYPEGPIPFGGECAGVVVAVNEGVEHTKVGDRVMAIAADSFSQYAKTFEYLTVPIPDGMSFEEAATIPITFLTSLYALEYLGRIRKGERVLIHSGAGGVGLSAIQLAQLFGAEVFATAGSAEKRSFLEYIGVRHVLNSRTFDFADEIMRITKGEGIDLVLSALPGEYMARSIGLLRGYGRYLDIGKTEIYQNGQLGLYPFHNNLSYFAIDIDRVSRERPEVMRELFPKLAVWFEERRLRPLPRKVYPLTESVDAFRFMAQSKNIGKVVLSLEGLAELEANAAPSPIKPDATYLITGGLGALGLRIAAWLVDQGATHVALLARRAPGAEQEAAIAELERGGAVVRAYQADVADEAALTDVVRAVADAMPPLRGVIHAAGVLKDNMLVNQTREQFETVMAPKVAGAWNLHRATLDAPLDFFVLFSSIAAVLGSPGQGNYAAGNAFLDALAYYRRGLGLPAISLDWGPWADSGMAAAASNRGQRLDMRGIRSISPATGLAVLGWTLGQPLTQGVVAPVDWDQLGELLKGKRRSPLLREMLGDDAGGAPAPAGQATAAAGRDELLALDPEARKAALLEHLKASLASILGLDAAEVSVEEPLGNLGLDSLMGLELKESLEERLKLPLPVELLMLNPSLNDLADQILSKLPKK